MTGVAHYAESLTSASFSWVSCCRLQKSLHLFTQRFYSRLKWKWYWNWSESQSEEQGRISHGLLIRWFIIWIHAADRLTLLPNLRSGLWLAKAKAKSGVLIGRHQLIFRICHALSVNFFSFTLPQIWVTSHKIKQFRRYFWMEPLGDLTRLSICKKRNLYHSFNLFHKIQKKSGKSK